MEKKTKSTKNLALCAYLHAKNFQWVNKERTDGSVQEFTFQETDESGDIDETMENYYNNGSVGILDIWTSMKLIKSWIHERD